MKSALITGSNGFIGQKLVRRLKQEKINAIEFNRQTGFDIVHPKDFSSLPKVDAVFHLAAVSGYKTSNENVNLAYEVNVGGTINVLNYCRRVNAKLIFPSTYVYAPPYTETKKETDQAGPTTTYSMTKWFGEQLCQFYSRVFNVNTLILRTGNVYGLGQKDIYIVPKVLKAILSGEKLILTKPDIERSFIYIDSLVDAYLKLAQANTRPGEIFNIGPNHPTKLHKLVEIIAKLTNKIPKIEYSGENRPNEGDKNRIDNSKVKATVNWQPLTNMETGLKKYLDSIHESD